MKLPIYEQNGSVHFHRLFGLFPLSSEVRILDIVNREITKEIAYPI